MKRNKRTEKICDPGLNPLTERILTKMGLEGAAIRRRLQIFYQTRAEMGEDLNPEGFPGRKPKQV